MGVYEGNAAVEFGEEDSFIGGPISISFVGSLDEGRSDRLLENRNGTPVWRETLGYERLLDGEEVRSGGSGLGVVGNWVVGIGVFAVTFVFF